MWLFGGAVWRRERGLTECRAPLRSRVGNPATGLFFELPGAPSAPLGVRDCRGRAASLSWQQKKMKKKKRTVLYPRPWTDSIPKLALQDFLMFHLDFLYRAGKHVWPENVPKRSYWSVKFLVTKQFFSNTCQKAKEVCLFFFFLNDHVSFCNCFNNLLNTFM